MLGVFVNTGAVIIGSIIGIIAKKGISKRFSDVIMKALALCVVYIGIMGVLDGKNTLVIILSMVLGTIIGEAIDLDKHLNTIGEKIENKFKGKDKGDSIAQGFVTSSLLFCVGALTIVGSLKAGLLGDNELLFTKAGLDFISAIIFASAFGIGVLLSAAFVLVFQGTIVILAGYVAPYLSDTVIGEMTCVGSLLIIALSLNMLGITKLKVMNFLPAIFFPIMLIPLYNLIMEMI